MSPYMLMTDSRRRRRFGVALSDMCGILTTKTSRASILSTAGNDDVDNNDSNDDDHAERLNDTDTVANRSGPLQLAAPILLFPFR